MAQANQYDEIFVGGGEGQSKIVVIKISKDLRTRSLHIPELSKSGIMETYKLNSSVTVSPNSS
jgi:hypothetical protein